MDRITSSVSQKLFGANRKAISPKSPPANFMDLKMPARIPRVDHVERNGQIGSLPRTKWFPLVRSTCGVLGWFLAYPTGGKCTCFFWWVQVFVRMWINYIHLPSMMKYTNTQWRTSHLKLLRWCMMVHGGSMKLLIYYKHIYTCVKNK